MINMANIQDAIVDLLKAGLTSNYTITKDDHINEIPDNTPWIGIYKGSSTGVPRTLGKGGGGRWSAKPEFKILLQSSDLESGADASDKLEEYKKAVYDVIVANPQLNGTVSTIVEAREDYLYDGSKEDSLYFQMVEITIVTEVRR